MSDPSQQLDQAAPTEADKTAQSAALLSTSEPNLSSMQPQQTGQQQASFTAGPVPGQQQMAFARNYPRPIVETAHQPYAQT